MNNKLEVGKSYLFKANNSTPTYIVAIANAYDTDQVIMILTYNVIFCGLE